MFGLGYGYPEILWPFTFFLLSGFAVLAYIVASPGARRCLTDFSFTRFLTTRIVPFLYGMSLVLGAAVALYAVGREFDVSVRGFFSLIVGVPLMFLIWAVVSRLFLEVLIVIFRIADNTAGLAPVTAAQPEASAAGARPPQQIFCLHC